MTGPDENWLDRMLNEARLAGVCTRYGCTTCGAKPFRENLAAQINELSSGTGSPQSETYIDALKDILPYAHLDAADLLAWNAVRLMGFESAARKLASTPWVYLISRFDPQLPRMRERQRQLEIEEAAARRDKERKLRAEAHALRSERKAKRDQIQRQKVLAFGDSLSLFDVLADAKFPVWFVDVQTCERLSDRISELSSDQLKWIAAVPLSRRCRAPFQGVIRTAKKKSMQS